MYWRQYIQRSTMFSCRDTYQESLLNYDKIIWAILRLIVIGCPPTHEADNTGLPVVRSCALTCSSYTVALFRVNSWHASRNHVWHRACHEPQASLLLDEPSLASDMLASVVMDHESNLVFKDLVGDYDGGAGRRQCNIPSDKLEAIRYTSSRLG